MKEGKETVKTRIGVIGTGGIASRHLVNCSKMDNVHISALCDIDEPKVKETASQYGAAAYTDYQKMLDEAELDLLLICTPPGFRIPAVEAAAARGIACFIEKPPAIDLKEAQQITDIIAKSGIIAGVGFMYRYAGAVQKAKELIAGMPVPIIRSVFVCGVALNPDWPRWFFNKSISGGPILDQAIHILDSSRYIAREFAGDITEIHAFGSNVTIPMEGDFSIEDSHVLNLRYDRGTIQSHTHSWAIKSTQVTIELLSNDFQLNINLNPEPGHHRSLLTGQVNKERVHFDFTDEDFYVTEMNAFIDAVRSKDQSLIRSPYADAAQTLQVVFSANQSVESRLPVTLGTSIKSLP
jgi:predicted dehydrogenase